MVIHYLKMALRHMLKYKLQSFISILGLTAGLFCLLICNYYNRAYMSGDKVFPTYSRMVIPQFRYSDMPEGEILNSVTNKEAILNEIDSICKQDLEGIAKYSFSEPALVRFYNRRKDNIIKVIYTNGDFFKVFPSEVIAGSLKRYSHDNNTAVITEKIAKRLFGDKSPVGKAFELKERLDNNPALTFDNNSGEVIETFRIIAVIKDYPSFIRSGNDWYKNEIFIRKDRAAFQRLMLFKSIDDIGQNNKRVAANHFSSDGKDVVVTLAPKSDESDINAPTIIIAIIGILVFSIGLTNFASFFIGSFWTRTRELNLRKMLGSSKSQLFIMLITEQTLYMVPVVILLFTFIELISMLYFMIPKEFINQLPPFELSLLYMQSLQYIFISYLMISIIALLSIKARNQKHSNHKLRNFMLGFQFFIALFFMLALAGTYQQKKITDISAKLNIPSEDVDRTVFWYPANHNNILRHKDELLHKIYQLSTVECVGKSYQDYSKIIENELYLFYSKVDSNWLELTGFKSIASNFKNNEPIAFYTPLYKEIEIYKKKEYDNSDKSITLDVDSIQRSVAGEVDYKLKLRHGNESAILINGNDQDLYNSFLIRLHSKSDVNSFITQLNQWQNEYTVEDENVITVPMREEFDNIGAQLMIIIFSFCSIVSLIITILGLYGAITLDTIHRQKEVAIRKVNGAQIKDIWWMFGRMYIRLYIIASALACMVGYAICLLSSTQETFSEGFFNYKNPLPWLIVLVISAIIVFMTVAWHINRISHMNPASIIKSE